MAQKQQNRLDFKPIHVVKDGDATFILSNGRRCTQPRWVTYFEVDVNEGPKEGLFVESQQQQQQQGEEEEENITLNGLSHDLATKCTVE